jgi:hypothetical protein
MANLAETFHDEKGEKVEGRIKREEMGKHCGMRVAECGLRARAIFI